MTETQQEFHMYSMHNFISTYNKMNNNLIDKSAVEEVIGLEKANKRIEELIEMSKQFLYRKNCKDRRNFG